GIVPKSRRWFGNGIGSARHIFDATGNKNIPITGFYRPVSVDNCGKPTAAKSVHGFSGNGMWQSRKQGTHPRNISVVLPGLVGTAHNHVVVCFFGNVWVSFCDFRNDQCPQIVRADGGQSSFVISDWGADAVN